MAFLAAMPFDFGNSDTLHPYGPQRLADLIELERLYDRYNIFHGYIPSDNRKMILKKRAN
jgi:hypothetical protein